TGIWPVPVEIEGAIPFADDRVHSAYDPDAVRRFWLALVEIDRVFEVFRSRFLGKVSPVHLFWGALDIAASSSCPTRSCAPPAIRTRCCSRSCRARTRPRRPAPGGTGTPRGRRRRDG